MNWCVVIPTYNNEKTLEKVVQDVLGITGDVIVVNDGSTDSTPLILEKFKNIRVVSYARNQGKGYALKKGFEAGRKGRIRICDHTGFRWSALCKRYSCIHSENRLNNPIHLLLEAAGYLRTG